MRIAYLVSKKVYPASPGEIWTADYIKQLIIKDFMATDHPEIIDKENTWILKNIIFDGAKTVIYGEYDTNVNTYEMLANIFNGKTPTGTEWTNTYDKAYFWFTGRLTTLGSWTSMYEGG